MKLNSAVNTRGDFVRVRIYDEEDQSKAKVWIQAEVPANPAKAADEPLHQKIDRSLLGIGAPSKLGELDRYRLRALHFARDIINTEIAELQKR